MCGWNKNDPFCPYVFWTLTALIDAEHQHLYHKYILLKYWLMNLLSHYWFITSCYMPDYKLMFHWLAFLFRCWAIRVAWSLPHLQLLLHQMFKKWDLYQALIEANWERNHAGTQSEEKQRAGQLMTGLPNWAGLKTSQKKKEWHYGRNLDFLQ